jgi:hypothetical protein
MSAPATAQDGRVVMVIPSPMPARVLAGEGALARPGQSFNQFFDGGVLWTAIAVAVLPTSAIIASRPPTGRCTTFRAVGIGQG